VVDLNCGLRDKELRELRWQQIDLINKKQLTVGKSKTDAGTGRVIPLNDTVMIALEAHAAWYIRRFGECKTGVVRLPRREGATERSHQACHDVKDGVDEGPRQSQRRRAVARQPALWSRNWPSRARATR
jgi:integrase